jgi:holo-[acyl-carrier protein] synthase
MRGVGTDIEEILRIKQLAGSEAFLNKCFTPAELLYAESKKAGRDETLAGMFCAKEAFSKAVGTGFRGFSLKDVEIVHDGSGRPYISLAPPLAERFDGKFHLSISHCPAYATAVVIYD